VEVYIRFHAREERNAALVLLLSLYALCSRLKITNQQTKECASRSLHVLETIAIGELDRSWGKFSFENKIGALLFIKKEEMITEIT
jgi:hypothetical protein